MHIFQLTKRLVTVGVAGSLISSLLLPGITHAQGSVGTAISPPTTELTTGPGETLTREIEVRNSGSESVTYTTAVNNFNAADESGAAAFSPIGDLASWVTVSPSSFTLGANQSKLLSVTIKVPQNAMAGGHYATVFAIAKPSTALNGSGSKIGQYIGSNILLNVTGNIREAGSIIEFRTAKPSYQQAEEIPFLVRIQNAGNTHIKPTGVVEIFNGSTKVSSVQVNGNQASVMPGSVRRFEVVSDKTLPSGKYKAVATVSFAGQTLTSQPVSFVIVGTSMMLSLVVLLCLALVIALYFALRPRRTRK